MSKKEILEKAIQKAIDGGWRLWDKTDNYYQCGKCKQVASFTEFNGQYHDDDGGKWHHKTKLPNLFEHEGQWLLGWTNENMDFETLTFGVNDIIFNHDFATSLWGNALISTIIDGSDLAVENRLFMGGELGYPNYKGSGDEPYIGFKTAAWQYHLQMMVVAHDPIKYLEEHI